MVGELIIWLIHNHINKEYSLSPIPMGEYRRSEQSLKYNRLFNYNPYMLTLQFETFFCNNLIILNDIINVKS